MGKKNVIYFDDLIDALYEWESFSCKPARRKMKSDEIINEDKTVRWNREQVIKNNEEHEKEVKMLNQEKNSKLIKFKELCYSYIIQETNVSIEKAKQIYSYLYNEYGELKTIIESLDNLLDLFKD